MHKPVFDNIRKALSIELSASIIEEYLEAWDMEDMRQSTSASRQLLLNYHKEYVQVTDLIIEAINEVYNEIEDTYIANNISFKQYAERLVKNIERGLGVGQPPSKETLMDNKLRAGVFILRQVKRKDKKDATKFEADFSIPPSILERARVFINDQSQSPKSYDALRRVFNYYLNELHNKVLSSLQIIDESCLAFSLLQEKNTAKQRDHSIEQTEDVEESFAPGDFLNFSKMSNKLVVLKRLGVLDRIDAQPLKNNQRKAKLLCAIMGINTLEGLKSMKNYLSAIASNELETDIAVERIDAELAKIGLSCDTLQRR